MVVRLTTSGERVVPVAALPGTGKTTALRTAREAFEAAGFDVQGCAMARTASGELREAGIDNATSIAELLAVAERLQAQGIEHGPRDLRLLILPPRPRPTEQIDAKV